MTKKEYDAMQRQLAKARGEAGVARVAIVAEKTLRLQAEAELALQDAAILKAQYAGGGYCDPICPFCEADSGICCHEFSEGDPLPQEHADDCPVRRAQVRVAAVNALEEGK